MAGSSICCAPCCGAQKTQSPAAAVALTDLRHLVKEPKRLERPSGDAAVVSSKRTLGENPAACKSSRVMFSVKRRLALNSLLSAACSMRVTFARHFRVIGKIVDMRREVVWHSDAVAASRRQVGQM